MKRITLCIMILFSAFNSIAQINMSDSTMQVIGYWDLNETLTYMLSNEKIKIQNTDTISRESVRYEVDITIIDSTSNSYTIKWHYRDYTIETDNEVMKRLSSIFDDMSIIIKTDEFGVFQEIVNWEDIKNFMLITTALLKDEFKDIPNMDQFISQLEAIYSTKEVIESTAIEEIHQFYYFHGVKYKLLDNYHSQSRLQNNFGGEPFGAQITFWLDEINYDDNNGIFRMIMEVDSTELTNATFDYVTKMANTLKAPAPKRDEFPMLTNETRRASRIHGSGWPIYSIETKEVKAEDVIQIEERIIEIK